MGRLIFTVVMTALTVTGYLVYIDYGWLWGVAFVAGLIILLVAWCHWVAPIIEEEIECIERHKNREEIE